MNQRQSKVLLILGIIFYAQSSEISYKQEQELFVSNLTGSNLSDVLITLVTVPVLILIAKLLRRRSKQSLILEYVLLIFPILCSFTIGANYNHITFVVSLFISCCLLYYRTSSKVSVDTDKAINLSLPFQNTYYITLFKGSIVLLTCISILAIDFHVFPRRYGKTETFGLSLMDTGVGLFIISSAVTSKYARTAAASLSIPSSLIQGQCLPKHQVKPESGLSSKDSPKPSLLPSWSISHTVQCLYQLLQHTVHQIQQHLLKHSIVLGLGIGRMIVLELLHYQKHVSEYGYHWNFFVTLFVVWTIADLCHTFIAYVTVSIHSLTSFMSRESPMAHYISSRSMLMLTAVLILIGYQWYLTAWHGSEWLLDNTNRDETLWTMNKEGIYSLGGYIPLYLVTECISSWCFFTVPMTTHTAPVTTNTVPVSTSTTSPPPSQQHQDLLFYRLVQLVILFAVLWILSDTYLQPTSRRLCNLPYVLFVLFIAMLLLLCMYLVDYATSTLLGGPLYTLQQMNQYSLYLFLFANVMTGMVNMCLHTLYVSTAQAMGVLGIYTLILTMSAWYIQDILCATGMWWRKVMVCMTEQ